MLYRSASDIAVYLSSAIGATGAYVTQVPVRVWTLWRNHLFGRRARCHPARTQPSMRTLIHEYPLAYACACQHRQR